MELISRIKRIHRTTGRMDIMDIGTMMESVQDSEGIDTNEVRQQMERFGSLIIGDYVYHNITQDELLKTLGQEVEFTFKGINRRPMVAEPITVHMIPQFVAVKSNGETIDFSIDDIQSFKVIHKGDE